MGWMRMYELRPLLESFWIVREQDKELYFSVKRAAPDYLRFVGELLGWKLIVHEKFIKLEKVPARAESFMGIWEFEEIMDYCLLCGVLIFLEDKDEGGQFLLSELTGALHAYLAELCPVDWTRFTHRKSLVRVLKYAERLGMLTVYEGRSDAFSETDAQEVLYENTGLSRYFAVQFSQDISQFKTVEDFESGSPWPPDAQRGLSRIHAVYRRLVGSPAVYWQTAADPDRAYLKKERQRVEANLSRMLGGQLHLHRDGAFFVLDQNDAFGAYHPRDLALGDVVLLVCAELRRQVELGVLAPSDDGSVTLSQMVLRRAVLSAREAHDAFWGKTLRTLTDDKLYRQVTAYMEDYMMLRQREEDVILYPAAGKWTGAYPEGLEAPQDDLQEDQEGMDE